MEISRGNGARPRPTLEILWTNSNVLMYYPRHSLRFIPDTYFTVFGIGGTTLCRGMKVRRWLTGGVNHVVGTGRKACVRYGPVFLGGPGRNRTGLSAYAALNSFDWTEAVTQLLRSIIISLAASPTNITPIIRSSKSCDEC